MENVSFICLLSLFLAISLCQQTVLAQFWPRPDSLLLFTPLDAENELTNIAQNVEPSVSYYPKLETTKPGPFGIANSSYTVSLNGSWIGPYDPFPTFPSFTVSTYFYVAGNSIKGGILLLDNFHFQNRFSIIYNGKSLQIQRYASSGDDYIGNFVVENFFTNGWTFVCFTYDDSTKTVTLYNENGKAIHVEEDFPILDLDKTGLAIGYGIGKTYYYMATGDAIACTMMYSQVLTTSEIVELPEVCKWKGKEPSPPEPWPVQERLIGLWPLSSQYKLNIANKAAAFNPVRLLL